MMSPLSFSDLFQSQSSSHSDGRGSWTILGNKITKIQLSKHAYYKGLGILNCSYDYRQSFSSKLKKKTFKGIWSFVPLS